MDEHAELADELRSFFSEHERVLAANEPREERTPPVVFEGESATIPPQVVGEGAAEENLRIAKRAAERADDKTQEAIQADTRAQRSRYGKLIRQAHQKLVGSLVRKDEYEVWVWDIHRRRAVYRMTGHRGPGLLFDMNAAGDRIVSGYFRDRGKAHVRVWDADKGKILRRLDSCGIVTSAKVSPDGDQICTAGVEIDEDGKRTRFPIKI